MAAIGSTSPALEGRAPWQEESDVSGVVIAADGMRIFADILVAVLDVLPAGGVSLGLRRRHIAGGL
ncbi:MAG TPA: hypothetical protein VMY87_04150 [Armatimonadota bacterium]|nr:hypothetical protein [Armatimonadota bacterium]